MTSTDIGTVFEIAESIWGSEYYESPEVFEQRLEWWPAGCWMYEDKGYLISHPSQYRCPPKLNSFVKYDYTDCYHIHDICLLPQAQGQGIADNILNKFWDWPVVTLVAANNTDAYWSSKGFQAKKQLDYGQYMVKRYDHNN